MSLKVVGGVQGWLVGNSADLGTPNAGSKLGMMAQRVLATN